MYSATFPKEIRGMAHNFLKPNCIFLKVGRIGGTTTHITLKVLWVDESENREKLREILMSQPPCRICGLLSKHKHQIRRFQLRWARKQF